MRARPTDLEAASATLQSLTETFGLAFAELMRASHEHAPLLASVAPAGAALGDASAALDTLTGNAYELGQALRLLAEVYRHLDGGGRVRFE